MTNLPALVRAQSRLCHFLCFLRVDHFTHTTVVQTFAKLCFSVVLYCVVHSLVWRTPVQDLAATDWHFPRLDIRSSFLPAFVVTVVTISEVQRKKKNSCPFKEKEVYFSTSGNNRIKETLYVYYIILYIALTFFV